MNSTVKDIFSVFKLRIGVAIMFCGLAGIAITPGEGPGVFATLVFALAVLLSSASAGAYNQYAERDLDASMQRTKDRPFVTGRFINNRYWLACILLILLIAVAATSLSTNNLAALYVFLGAFTYGVVYTVWLKRRTWLNIVIGGLAGSFAVLAGAAAVDTTLTMAPLLLAIVLFLWTPPHFWSFAFVFAKDYERAGVPMLPVVMDKQTAARVIFVHALALFIVSILPFFYGMGWVYLCGALAGGAYFLSCSYRLVNKPTIEVARKNFKASLLQLSLLLLACIIDASLPMS